MLEATSGGVELARRQHGGVTKIALDSNGQARKKRQRVAQNAQTRQRVGAIKALKPLAGNSGSKGRCRHAQPFSGSLPGPGPKLLRSPIDTPRDAEGGRPR
ncbi:hypothetical protein A3K70_00190 [Candidatus Bathyarchaeota archaeon RBG_16_48_13]|nr:MAG: hypothetical protein A3K70_00190 [Candidatus Bathyarchaeota archaeon RBG_16_48_13]